MTNLNNENTNEITVEGKLRSYLLESADELKDVVNELNSWNGCMDEFQVYENDEDFFETYFENKPMEAVRATYYGKYDFSDYYVRFNGYGNLESLSEYALEKEMKDSINEIVDNLIEYASHLCLSSEIEEILENEEEEEEEE